MTTGFFLNLKNGGVRVKFKNLTLNLKLDESIAIRSKIQKLKMNLFSQNWGNLSGPIIDKCNPMLYQSFGLGGDSFLSSWKNK